MHANTLRGFDTGVYAESFAAITSEHLPFNFTELALSNDTDLDSNPRFFLFLVSWIATFFSTSRFVSCPLNSEFNRGPAQKPWSLTIFISI